MPQAVYVLTDVETQSISDPAAMVLTQAEVGASGLGEQWAATSLGAVVRAARSAEAAVNAQREATEAAARDGRSGEEGDNSLHSSCSHHRLVARLEIAETVYRRLPGSR